MLPDDVTRCKACGRMILRREADDYECCPYCHNVGYTTSCRVCRRALRTSTCPVHGSPSNQLLALKGSHHDDPISHDVLSSMRSNRREHVTV